MGPGHLGVGLAAKCLAPKAPLMALLVASEALDLLSFGFIAAGVEEVGITSADFSRGLEVIALGSMPWSHGLFMSIFWSLLIVAIAFIITRDRRTSGILGLVVFSHWVLDFIVHPPDLPLLFNNSPRVGLGVWTSGSGLVASIALELALICGGCTIYLAAHRRISLPKQVKAQPKRSLIHSE